MGNIVNIKSQHFSHSNKTDLSVIARTRHFLTVHLEVNVFFKEIQSVVFHVIKAVALQGYNVACTPCHNNTVFGKFLEFAQSVCKRIAFFNFGICKGSKVFNFGAKPFGKVGAYKHGELFDNFHIFIKLYCTELYNFIDVAANSETVAAVPFKVEYDVLHILFSSALSFKAFFLIKNHFSHADRFGSNFNKFVITDKFK